MIYRRQSDRWQVLALLTSFALNLIVCALNLYYTAKFVGLIKLLGDEVEKQERMKRGLFLEGEYNGRNN